MYPADDPDDYDESSPSKRDVDASSPSGADDPPTPLEISSDDEILVIETPFKEQVLLEPKVFCRACKEMKLKPSIDLFASATYKQLHCYFGSTAT